jgi:D-aminoacyl-tRNA deacylase
MRAVIQRVARATVAIEGLPERSIGPGLVVLVGVEPGDGPDDVVWLSGKICRLRVFPDAGNQMNESLLDSSGNLLVISQFTLHASTRKGNRPSFSRAAPPPVAKPMYEAFVQRLEQDLGRPVVTGEFGAHMQVALVNDGPVTLWMDTRNRE